MDGLYLLHLMLFSLLGASLSSWLVYEFDNHGRSYVTAYERFFARSKCDHCNAEIKLIHLFPVFSYIYLAGKTSCCQKKLSEKYLSFESLGTLLFTLGFTTGYIDLSFLGLLVVFTIFVDEKYKEIPLWTNAAIFLWVITFGAEMLKINLLPALILVLILLLIYLFFLKVRNIEGIGFADIILLFSLALYLGFPNYLYLLTIASASLLFKIFLTKKYVEQHAFGSWIVGVFALFILFQEFYASANLNST